MKTRRSREPEVTAELPPPDAPMPPPPELAAHTRLVVLEEGLHALTLGALERQAGAVAGIGLPAINVSAPPSSDYDFVEIPVTSGELANWFGPEGGVAIVRSPPGGGAILVTAYGAPEVTAAPAIDIRRLDPPAASRTHSARPAPAQASAQGPAQGPAQAPDRPPAEPPPPTQGDRAIASEIVLHIEREGDRRFAAQGWVGNRGRRLRVEAFAIRPLEGLSSGDIEYKAFGPNGRETPWVSGAKLCGTRGRGLPLTGFAVRVAPHLRDRYEVVYEGSFFNSGVAGPHRNGEPCMPSVYDDPLEAINLRVIARGTR